MGLQREARGEPCVVWAQGIPCSQQRAPLTHAPASFCSDYVIEDKVAVLQKRDHEGFGFVLRGAKGECSTPGLPVALPLCGFLPHRRESFH